MSKISRKPMLPASLSSQVRNGVAAHDEIQQVADYLADLMRGVYGGDWRVSVNHEARFVMIAEDFS
ncbi:hypothetical protein [Agrobacterium sp. SUL3]|uniref:hypothetical protein n=1 Tax=Agrobacterium sp. SUL3 TaxID=1701910 RepID=UPI00069B17DE|nr:hypothetical protein [Agrobacterium sp. SUL3]KNY35578.1 hypothetical protein AKG12_00620 [Agrobacterium sp. SUL3]